MRTIDEFEQPFITKFYNSVVHETLLPLLVMTTTPHITLLIAYIIVDRNSDLKQCLITNPLHKTLNDAWNSVDWFDTECWSLVIGLILWGIISLQIPGPEYSGPPTINGFRPKYWNNGFRFYIISMITSVVVIAKYSVLHLYYKIPSLVGILIVFGFTVCLALYLKGILRPDPGVCEVTKNPIFDFYWGTELYPQLGPYVSLKLLIICRFSLYLWQLIVLISWKANYELNSLNIKNDTIDYPMTATTILQTIYLAKFYYWEDGYMATIDVIAEKFGYYIAWGCIAFVPGFYTTTSLYLVEHSPVLHFGLKSFILILSAGFIVIILTYLADLQKQLVRDNNGKVNIWGKPAKIIRAQYIDDFGNKKKSILLFSGYWGLARHMNYTLELMTALVWSLPALMTSPIPYLYFIFLFFLLIHRTVRDDNRCSQKYGVYWDQYRKHVKYQMIPRIF